MCAQCPCEFSFLVKRLVHAIVEGVFAGREPQRFSSQSIGAPIGFSPGHFAEGPKTAGTPGCPAPEARIGKIQQAQVPVTK
jgi:hypothetical protein